MRGITLIALSCSLGAHAALVTVAVFAFDWGVTKPELLGTDRVYPVSFEGSAVDRAMGLAAPALVEPEHYLRLPEFNKVSLPEPSRQKPKERTAAKKSAATTEVVQPSTVENVALGTSTDASGAECRGCSEAQHGQIEGFAPITVPKPAYPQAARRAGFEGRVLLEILVGTDGRVRNAEVVTSSGREDCDTSARTTVLERWRFSPARRFGTPVEWRERVAVVFQLR